MKVNIKFKKLDHIQICISTGKENEAREFYTDVLGLKEIPKPNELLANGGLWYEIADIQLHIGIEDETTKSKQHPAFEIQNVNQVKEYLVKNNVRVKEETKIQGVHRFSFKDPFGNRIELLEKNNKY